MMRVQKAFTLIEIMVVIVIIAIAATMTFIGVGNFIESRHAQGTATKLYATFKVAQVQAILQPTVIGMVITQRGYAFFSFETSTQGGQASWQAMTKQHVFRAKEFPSGIVLKLTTQDNPIDLSKSNSDDLKKITPSILFLPNGNMTAFTLTVGTQKKPAEYNVQADNIGNIRLKKSNNK